MKRLFLLLFFFLFIVFPLQAQERLNNIYGIHLAQPHLEDLKKAAELVNSSGGDWGYVTLVIQENDRNQEKWQAIFDQLRSFHLIPIIRLATKPQGDIWLRPNNIDADGWASFLESLNWVVKNRYVVLFNEPNHAQEWGGQIDPKSYGEIALSFARKLKEKNSDYFIMLAGFDASAPHQPPQFWDETVFLNELFRNLSPEEFEKYFDGWASHSYPNPNFSSPPSNFGRVSLTTYRWELQLLRSLGIKKELPVFITETGWKRTSLSENTIANYFQVAYQQIWGADSIVKAATPFILNYQDEPFLDFSWQKFQSHDFYQYYYHLQSLPKIKGEPEQKEAGKLIFQLPKELVVNSQYHLNLYLKNEGQAIWDENDGYQLLGENLPSETRFLFSPIKDLKPFEEKMIPFVLKTGRQTGNFSVDFFLMKNEQRQLKFPHWQFAIVPLPSLKFSINYWPFGKGKGDDFEIQIFNPKEELVFFEKGVKVDQGFGEIKEVQNITLGEKYRVVVLKKGFLPRQTHLVFQKEKNLVKFKPMLPFDPNGDGRFSLGDILFFLK